MAKKRIISASELQSYAYCPRAWAYKKLGYPQENRRELEAGSEFHQDFGSRDRAIRVLRVVILIAMLLLLFFMIRRYLI